MVRSDQRNHTGESLDSRQEGVPTLKDQYKQGDLLVRLLRDQFSITAASDILHTHNLVECHSIDLQEFEE